MTTSADSTAESIPTLPASERPVEFRGGVGTASIGWQPARGKGRRVVPFVFISYRRGDQDYAVDGLRKALIAALGEGTVFHDESDIPAGSDYRTTIARGISNAETVLVVMGDGWGIERLADPADDVRIEIELALRSKKFLLPIFLERAGPPPPESLPASMRDIVFTNGLKLRSGRDFDRDVAEIVATVMRAAAATLSIELKSPGFMMIGDLAISLDGTVVARDKMRKGMSIPPARVTVGRHIVRTEYSAGGISRAEDHPIDVGIGANHLRLSHHRASGKFSASVTR